MDTTLAVQLAKASDLQRQGQLAQAHNAYLAIVRAHPTHPAALGTLAALQTQLGLHHDAVASLRTLCDLAPDDPKSQRALGVALLMAGGADAAVASLRKATALAPQDVDAHSALGAALVANHAREEAKAAFRQAVDLEPRRAQAMNELCDLLIEDDDLDAAVLLLQGILAQQPDHVSARYKLGYVHLLAGNLALATACFMRVARDQPDYAPTFLNLGSVASWNQEPYKAEMYFRKALALQPQYPEALDNLGRTLLAQGKYREGWSAVESYMKAAETQRPFPNIPLWDGRPNRETFLLVYPEQGLGDAIQFARYLRLAQRRVGRLLLFIDGYWRPLRRLFESLDGVDELLDATTLRVKVSKACSLLSLPYLLDLDAPDPEPRMQYLTPHAADVDRWQERLGPSSKLSVGLVWAGNPRPWQRMASMIDRRRSVNFDTLRPLLGIADVRFVSLQLGERGAVSASVLDFTSEIQDMGDTAALIAQLDVVITVDTAVAHVAGAIGKPVWLLNRFDSCWRWGIGGETTAWYPTMRIFRQAAFGDWSTVVTDVATELTALRDAHAMANTGRSC